LKVKSWKLKEEQTSHSAAGRNQVQNQGEKQIPHAHSRKKRGTGFGMTRGVNSCREKLDDGGKGESEHQEGVEKVENEALTAGFNPRLPRQASFSATC